MITISILGRTICLSAVIIFLCSSSFLVNNFASPPFPQSSMSHMHHMHFARKKEKKNGG